MSDWTKSLLRWIGWAVVALVTWLGAATDIPEKVMTSIMGTRS